jgi:predicted component of type VI protein secretion system
MATPSSIEERIARLEGLFEQIERRLGSLEQGVRALRPELNGMNASLNARIDRLWQLGLMAAIGASILATILSRLL